MSNKKNSNREFQDKFKGKLDVMDKEGHIGVVMNSNKPIKKMSRPSTNLSYDFLPEIRDKDQNYSIENGKPIIPK
jgi:hypothetical protein